MRAWMILLGPFLLWAVHFGGVYAIASLFAVAGDAASPTARAVVAGFSLLLLASAAALGLFAARQARREVSESRCWMSLVGTLGAAMAALSIGWQGLPALMGY